MQFKNYSEYESEILNDTALDIFGTDFDWLSEDDQSYIECFCMDEGLI